MADIDRFKWAQPRAQHTIPGRIFTSDQHTHGVSNDQPPGYGVSQPKGHPGSRVYPQPRHGFVTVVQEQDESAKPQTLREHPLLLQLRTFSSAVTIGGLRYTGDQNISAHRRLFWALLVCFGLSFALYQINSQINYFLSNPSTVRISITDQEELVFPTITFCSENLWNRSALDEIDPSGNMSWMFREINRPYQFDGQHVDMARLNEIVQLHGGNDWKPVYDKGQLDVQQFVLQCTYDAARCEPAQWTQVPTRMGNCYQINPYGNMTSTVPGYDNGLRLVLSADVANYNGVHSPAAGFRVFVQTKADPPKFTSRAFRLGVNRHHQIQIANKQVSRLPPPYGNCSDADGYTYPSCAVRCYEEHISDECGCRTPCFDTDAPLCSPIELMTCYWSRSVEYMIHKLQEKICDCPDQCFEQLYPYQISSNDLSNYYQDWMIDNFGSEKMTREYIEENLMFVDVYYDNLKLEKVEAQPAYSLLSLLCDVGGALGLILGSTILTAFEIGDFMVVSVWNLFFGDIVKPTARKHRRSTGSESEISVEVTDYNEEKKVPL